MVNVDGLVGIVGGCGLMLEFSRWQWAVVNGLMDKIGGCGLL